MKSGCERAKDCAPGLKVDVASRARLIFQFRQQASRNYYLCAAFSQVTVIAGRSVYHTSEVHHMIYHTHKTGSLILRASGS
jgi:hypothetical protein